VNPKGTTTKLGRKTLLAVLALAVLAAAAAGIARSTGTELIPDANGVIHACYKKPIGDVKIVRSAADCGPGHAPIEWSQAGPQGPKGDPGPPGPAGASGAGVQVFESETLDFVRLTGEVFLLSASLGEPGTYAVIAKGEIATGLSPGTRHGRCHVEIDGVELDGTSLFTFAPDDSPFLTMPFALADIVHVSRANAVVDAVCRTEPGPSGPVVRGLRIVALRAA
jgi:hypothetical protein